ncbi:MAG: Hpt domain-containing protein [Thermodesulfobacteriota bacterium]
MVSDILKEFVEDAREHLQAASQHLLALEKDGRRADDLNGLLRRLHTIKGNSGFLDLRGLYGLLHKAENILQTVREQFTTSCDCPQGLIDVLFQVLDTVETMLNQLSEDQSDQVEWLDRLMDSLDSIDSALNEHPAPTEQRASAEVGPEARPAVEPNTRPTDVDLETSGPAQPASAEAGIESDPFSPVEAKIGMFLHRLAAAGKEEQDRTLESLREELEWLKVELDRWAGPQAGRALKMARDYLSEIQVFSRPLADSSRALLKEMMDNLVQWLRTEKPGPLEVGVIQVAPEDLEPPGEDLHQRLKEMIRRGAGRLVFDLRGLNNLHSAQITVLMSLYKAAPDPGRVGLILDRERQTGLLRVLKTLALDKVFLLYTEESQARSDPA